MAESQTNTRECTAKKREEQKAEQGDREVEEEGDLTADSWWEHNGEHPTDPHGDENQTGHIAGLVIVEAGRSSQESGQEHADQALHAIVARKQCTDESEKCNVEYSRHIDLLDNDLLFQLRIVWFDLCGSGRRFSILQLKIVHWLFNDFLGRLLGRQYSLFRHVRL